MKISYFIEVLVLGLKSHLSSMKAQLVHCHDYYWCTLHVSRSDMVWFCLLTFYHLSSDTF